MLDSSNNSEPLGIDSLFEYVDNIDVFYSITTNTINFSKYDVINPEVAKEVIANELEKQNSREFNLVTKLFFIIHSLLSYFVKGLDEQYTKAAQQLSELYRANMIQDPKA